jgi:hypothetical protein
LAEMLYPLYFAGTRYSLAACPANFPAWICSRAHATKSRLNSAYALSSFR